MVKDNKSMHVTVTVGHKKKLCEVHARHCDRFISISNFHHELRTYMYIYMYMYMYVCELCTYLRTQVRTYVQCKYSVHRLRPKPLNRYMYPKLIHEASLQSHARSVST